MEGQLSRHMEGQVMPPARAAERQRRGASHSFHVGPRLIYVQQKFKLLLAYCVSIMKNLL